jgi:hypothetical protein
VLLDLRAAGAGQVRVDVPTEASAKRRQTLEDPIGVRWADFHPGTGQPVVLRLPAVTWSPGPFYLRSRDREDEYRIPAGASSVLSSIEPARPTAVRRGAAHEAFRQLFERPFDRSALSLPPEISVAASADPAADFSARQKTALSLAGVGVGGLAVGAGLWWSARGLREDGLAAVPALDGMQRSALNERIRDRNRWAVISGSAGAALIGVGAALWLWKGSSDGGEVEALGFVPLGGGGLVQVRVGLR